MALRLIYVPGSVPGEHRVEIKWGYECAPASGTELLLRLTSETLHDIGRISTFTSGRCRMFAEQMLSSRKNLYWSKGETQLLF